MNSVKSFLGKLKTNEYISMLKESRVLNDHLFYALIGVILFLTVYGFTPLNVTNDHWILNEYVEKDVIQHYTGWVAYRNSDWSFPIGTIDGIDGAMLTYMDSIPWVSVFFKILAPVLPRTFQFFGLYILLCFILQAVSSGLLIETVIKNKFLSYCGVILFTLSPIMIERAFRHTALASHWLIILSLYLYIVSRRNLKLSRIFIIIAVISIGIHPYFLPFVFGSMLFCLIDISIKNRRVALCDIVIFASSLVLTVGAGYLIGALGTSSNLNDWGYGYFSLNLNSIINPTSCGDIKWSLFLPVLPQYAGGFDGFNYLGVGIIILAITATVILIKQKDFFRHTRNNICLLVLCGILTLYAISNLVTLNDKVLFEIPMPQWFLNFAGIFRASGRMFYLVYYVIFIYALRGIEYLKPNYLKITIAAVVIVQILDISPAIVTKHKSFNIGAIESEYSTCEFENNEWKQVFTNCSEIKLLNKIDDYKLAAFSVKNGLSTQVSILNSRSDSEADYSRNFMDIFEHKDISDTAYVTNDANLITLSMMTNDSILAYRTGTYYTIVSDKNEIQELTPISLQDCTICVCDLTNSGWTNGISTWEDNKILLFRYSDTFLTFLRANDQISAGSETYHIENITHDDYWIHVYVDKPADGCKYPNPLTFQNTGSK